MNQAKYLSNVLSVSVALACASAFGDMFNPPAYVGPVDAAHARATRRMICAPSISVAANGRLWATWFAGPTEMEDEYNYVVLATSADDGKTWKECAVVDPDGPGVRRTFDSQVWITPDGRLAWFWADRTGGPEDFSLTDGLWVSYLKDATADFSEMSRPQCVAHGVMNNKPIALKDGTWVLPVCAWFSRLSSGMVVSTDKGVTWTFRGGATIPAEDRAYDEHAIVEMTNGDLWTFSRCCSGIRRAISSDKGMTWTPAEQFPNGSIRHTCSRSVFRRLASGNLLLIKHGRLDQNVGRKDMTAYLSRDDGKTWEGGLLLDERNSACYPLASQASDGLVYCAYDFERETCQNVYFCTFTEADILAKKNVSGRVRLRQVIHERERK